MALRIVQDSSPEQFLEQATPLLYRDEATNSLMLGICENIARLRKTLPSTPLLVRVLQGDRTVTAAVQTSTRNVVLTHARDEELNLLARHMRNIGANFPGVVGPAREAETFATIWSDLAGKKVELAMRQRIYKIEHVRLPDTAGHLQLAEADDSELIAEWMVAFAEESLPLHEQKPIAERRPDAARVIENRSAYFWMFDNKPVAMAHISRRTQHGASLNAVYTPRHLRKNGFASAVVAHLSQATLDAGKQFCVLYTDLANPTSNKIYQDIGYQEVSDSRHYLFENNDA